MKRIISLAILLCMLTLQLTACKIETPEQHNNVSDSDKEKISVSLQISCATILNNLDKADKDIIESIPNDGIILEKETVALSEDGSVYDLLLKISKEKQFSMTFSGTEKSVYITSIADIQEFAVGASSGWKYTVNGDFASETASTYILKEGDDVAFLYTCDLGEDIKSSVSSA